MKNSLYRDMGVLISLYSGLRIGEVCGLKWEDIDFENKIIEIKRTVQRVFFGRKQTKVIVTVPKTRKSLSEVLGHSNIGITLATYVHSSYEQKKKYIDKL